MNDNQLFALVRSTILAGLAARGYALREDDPQGWDVARSFSPEQSGADSAPTVYMFKLGPDRPVGSPKQADEWDADAQVMRRTTHQRYETTFQLSIVADESTDEDAATPSDAAIDVAAIMQTDEGVEALAAECVGVLKVSDLRNPYNVNDRGEFAASPSFDLVLSYGRGRTSETPFATSIEGSVNRV